MSDEPHAEAHAEAARIQFGLDFGGHDALQRKRPPLLGAARKLAWTPANPSPHFSSISRAKGSRAQSTYDTR